MKQRRVIDANSRRVAVFPAPFKTDDWSRVGNQYMRAFYGAVEERGWRVEGVNVHDVLRPMSFVAKGFRLLHVHWTEELALAFSWVLESPVVTRVTKLSGLRWAVAHMLLPYCCSRVRRWKRGMDQSGLKVVWQIHEIESHGLRRFGPQMALDSFVKESVYHCSHAICLHEASCLDPVLERFKQPKPYAVTPLGDYARFHGVPVGRVDAQRSLGISARGRVISFVGIPHPNRDPAEVIAAFLGAAGPDDLLLLAGPYLERYAAMTADHRVQVFSGLLPNEQMRDVFCASDFVVSHGRRYMTSSVVRAAISYGTPVIAYAYGAQVDMAAGAAVYIRDESGGLDQALKHALIMREGEYQRLVGGCIQRSAERSWDGAAEALCALYGRLLGDQAEV